MTKKGLSVYERVMLRVQRTESGCLEYQGSRDKRGYGSMGITRKGEPFRSVRAHRVVFEHHNGPVPADKPFVLHRCDNPPCVEVSHLYAGTHADNMRDMLERNRRHQPAPMLGAANHLTKLTDEQVQALRQARIDRPDATFGELADEFGISHWHARRIVKGYRRKAV